MSENDKFELLVTCQLVVEAMQKTREKMEELGFAPEIAEGVNFAMGFFTGYLVRKAPRKNDVGG